LRFSGILALGALAKFGIFVGMHSLIAQDFEKVGAPLPLIIVNAIMDELTETPIMKRVVEPLPEIVTPPQSRNLGPKINNEDPSFGVDIIAPPQIGTELSQPSFNIDQQPRAMVRVNPTYPNKAARDGIQGFVTLSFSVNARGEVEHVQVVKGQGSAK
jgi:protein TonB